MMRIRPLCHLSSRTESEVTECFVRHMIIGSCSETSSPEFSPFSKVPLQPSKSDRFLTAGVLLFNLNPSETPEPGLDMSDFEAHSSCVGSKKSFKSARFVVSMSTTVSLRSRQEPVPRSPLGRLLSGPATLQSLDFKASIPPLP
jgi:hypothetical protein